MKLTEWAFLLMALALTQPTAKGQQPKPIDHEPLHGTVNVILANGDDLVAATDSMLSSGIRRTTSATKLYKIDDRTVVTMASFYEEDGPTADNTLTASIPQMMLEFSDNMSMLEHASFDMKADALFSEIKFKLDRHINAMLAANPQSRIDNPAYLIELTVAGYDLDNSLKIAEITMEPEKKDNFVEYVSRPRPVGRFTPDCAFTAGIQRMPEPYGDPEVPTNNGPIVHIVQVALFCEIAGLRDVPEQMLESPASYPDDASLQAYANARAEKKPLTSEQLRALALDLVQKTADSERRTGQRRVGRDVEIAVLANEHIVEEPMPAGRTDKGSALTGNQFVGLAYTCNSSQVPLGPEGNRVRTSVGTQEFDAATLTSCTQELDGLMFLNSTFIDSHLTYSGKSILFFPDTNVVANTTLELSTDVDIHKSDVHHLICAFPWKSISQGTVDLKPACE